jgi:NitT/TauT family transport system ATP-binding protein
MDKLRLSKISKVFPRARGDVEALRDVSVAAKEGEFFCFLGTSGCGKTTLLRIVAGLERQTSGEVLLVRSGAEHVVTGPGPDRGMVFQELHLFPWRTALRNVEFGLEFQGFSSGQRAARAQECLALVGLSEFGDRYPYELSGGMRQRVGIARALAPDPEVLLMDEPFAALDAQTRMTLQDELLRIWKATRKTILFVTHAIDEAVYLGSKIVLLTSRPGSVKAEVEPALVYPRDRLGTEFINIVRSLRAALREEAVPSTSTAEQAHAEAHPREGDHHE